MWLGAILLAYCGLVAIAYAVGPAERRAKASSGCSMGGQGTITAGDGDRSSFTILAASAPAQGALRYRDAGPNNARLVRSTKVTNLTCTPDSGGATIAGRATVNGARSVTYRVEVELGSSAAAPSSYRIVLSDGYDSGVQQLEHGNLGIHSGKAR
jgi:hypothetical protein